MLLRGLLDQMRGVGILPWRGNGVEPREIGLGGNAEDGRSRGEPYRVRYSGKRW